MKERQKVVPLVYRRFLAGQSAWIAASLAALAICVSTMLLYLIVWEHGAILAADSISYLGGAIGLFHGEGISFGLLEDSGNTIVINYMTHYPPLLSVIYALLLWLGVPYIYVPAVLTLICWVILLLGIGTLAYRLYPSPRIAALVVVLAAFTHAYLWIFQQAMSEVLFLPLLVWLMVVLTGLHEREQHQRVYLAGAVVLLALVLLTRYVGVFVLAAVVLWWCWVRAYQRRWRLLLLELCALSLSALPLAAWLLRNRYVKGWIVNNHFSRGPNTFLEGVMAVIEQTSQVLVPAVRPLAALGLDWGVLSPAIPFVHLPVLLLLGFLFWRFRPHSPQLLSPPRSPVLVFLAIYIGLYTFLQPFMAFAPMDERDMTSLLCLAQPWLLGLRWRCICAVCPIRSCRAMLR